MDDESGGLDRGARSEEMVRATEAAARWRTHRSERERRRGALRDGHFLEADTPERLVKWVNRRQAWTEVLEAKRAGRSEPGRPLRSEDVSDELIERLLSGTKNLLSIEFFELGMLAARCVGRIVTEGEANGTGFLVAPGLMLTNEHVLRTPAQAEVSELELDYEANRVGPAKSVEVFALRPDHFFFADPTIDFCLVGVDLVSASDAALDSFKILPLIHAEGKATTGEPVNIIQHPLGQAKQVVLRNNEILDLPQGRDAEAFLHYRADTKKGSSGSPVFNDFWEVVALHRTGVPATNEAGELVDAEGQVLRSRDPARWVWVANEGVRVSRIVRALSGAQLSEAMGRVRDEALETWRVRGDPRVAVAVADEPGGAGSSPVVLDRLSAEVGEEALGPGEAASPGSGDSSPVTAGSATLELVVPVRVQLRVSVTAPAVQSVPRGHVVP